jgi:hypothetical protein
VVLVFDVLVVAVDVVALVPVVPVPDVLVIPVSVPLVVVVIDVAEVSLDIVPVVPVDDMPVSVDTVVDESVEEVSVTALVFSVLVQATTPKSATSARARKMTSDFFIFGSLLKE